MAAPVWEPRRSGRAPELLTDRDGPAGELIAEAAVAPVAGWDLSWQDGRAPAARPSWGCRRGAPRARARVQRRGSGVIPAADRPGDRSAR